MVIKQQILEAEKRLVVAMLEKDLPLLNDLFDEEYVFTSARGETWGKVKALADFHDPGFSIQELSVSELDVIVRGNIAVVTGLSRVKGCEGDSPLAGVYRFTRVWSISDGDWRIITAHTSRIDPT